MFFGDLTIAINGFLMVFDFLPSLLMVFDGSGPLVKRCDGFDGSSWSNNDLFVHFCLRGSYGTASLGCNRVCNGKTHRCMAKDIYHGKSHGIWVLPCSGLSHSSMVKAMGIMKLYIHGFCHGPLLHGFCNALFKRKTP